MNIDNKHYFSDSEIEKNKNFNWLFYSKIIEKVFPSFSNPTESRFSHLFSNSKSEDIKINNNSKRKTMTIIKDNILNGKDKRTTIMIKNLPRYLKYENISSIFLLENYINYLYIPIDSNSGNILGFAFVNMKKYYNILDFLNFFEGKWKILNSNGSNKKYEICYSSVQGVKILKKTFGNHIL